MKLNAKRTTLVGLAFLSICAFWQMYDFTVPLVLKNTYGLGDTWAGLVMAMDNIVALFLLPLFGALSDRTTAKLGRRMPYIVFGTLAAVILLLFMPVIVRRGSLTVFLISLGLLLLAMGTYRSPAVALMPDVTPKALRSKANAIINLMGAVGGVISLGMIKTLVVRTTDPATGTVMSDYGYLYIGVAAVMAICVIALLLTVRERKLVAEMEAINYGEDPASHEEAHEAATGKINPDVMKSLVLILCSVALWFMGYNAVTTAFSKYATSVWGASESMAANCLLIATVAAILSYWPVGQISSRIGRKKTIQFGILLLFVCFAGAALIHEMGVVMIILFGLVGLAWASINVNSFPMVVELATGADTGKYTGYYYTFSMAAQVLTPVLSGALLEHVGYHTLFPYATLMVGLSFVTMLFVRHGDNKPHAKRGLEALDVGD